MAFVTVVGAALAAYLATWSGWLRGSDGYERQWAAANPASGPLADLVPDAVRSLWHYHATQYDLLSGLDSEHNWQSSPAGWLILLRPVLFYRDKPGLGEDGCTATECVGDILAVGTPLTWWVGVAAAAARRLAGCSRGPIGAPGLSWPESPRRGCPGSPTPTVRSSPATPS